MTVAEIPLLAFLCAAVLFAPRRLALLALFAGFIYLSPKSGISLAGLRMFPVRFLEIAAFIRVFSRKEFSLAGMGRLDWAVLLAYGTVTALFLIRTALGYGTSPSIKIVSTFSKIGDFADIVLLYAACRGLLQNADDLRWLLQKTVFLLVPFVVAVVVERITWRNPLAFLGSQPSIWLDASDGRIRCFGTFLHPALLGSFGAVMTLSYVALIMVKGYRVSGVIGALLGFVLVILANSGGPLTMLAGGLVGWGCWLIRKNMKLLRYGLLGSVILLAIVMKDPIWYLPSKMSILFGGGGWHRSYLMNQAITNLRQWWLAGMPLDLTAAWFPYLTLGAADITNLFISFGIDGGLISLLLFVRVIVVGFSETGKSLAARREAGPATRADELLLWATGVVLVGHTINFFSITYFDQMVAIWIFNLATIASLAATRGSVAAAPVPTKSRRRGFRSRPASRRPGVRQGEPVDAAK